MIIGFSGTQSGMTQLQLDALGELLRDVHVSEAHHGDCVGADEQFHKIVRHWHPGATIVIHPGLNARKRAFCRGDVILEPKDNLARNHDIAEVCRMLFAGPKEQEMIQRSGTWATVRYTQNRGKQVIVVPPDGVAYNA